MMADVAADEMRTPEEKPAELPFDAIAIGSGPSFYPWVRGEIPKVPLFGAGVVGRYVKLDTYCIGDLTHERNMQIGVETFATNVVIDLLPREPWIFSYDLLGEPHGGSSGGMAVAVACLFHRRVGLVGFDGGMAGDADKNFRNLLQEWRDRGRKFISLMGVPTPFDDILEP